MVTGTIEISKTDEESLGLVSSHQYTLLDVKKVNDQNGNEVTLVKLRNPHGSTEWKGAWKDDGSEWTPQAVSAVNKDPIGDDGIFWMSMNDFTQYFSD